MTAKITVLILTKNEAALIGRVIGSVRSVADEIVVVDSGSDDWTGEIAHSLGAKVVHQPWLGFLPQKAVGVAAASNDWILSLDADEIVTPELAASIAAMKAGSPDAADGWSLQRDDEFLGRMMPDMRRASKRDGYVRLFNRTRSGWDPLRPIHEVVLCPGRIHQLAGSLVHWRNYSIGRQLETMNRYSDVEASIIVRDGGPKLRNLFLKPIARFFWIYFLRSSWKAGVRGFIWAGLHSTAEFLRQAKAWESANVRPCPHPPGTVVETEPSDRTRTNEVSP
jgi:(heptosyl)LPS beta-1,4-glucosyltransferase